MQSKVQRWGNSLAVRIPKVFALDVGLEEDAAVELSVHDGDLVISPVAPASLSLEGLLSKITDENLHQEVETGPAVGYEVW
ncbi:MAG TPA: AbrB/MazE/SpoVT family DNA-binding domain-containing protein [Thermoanaerobaculia bacterium]|nr:AbrB/MazE/SpoVT family DNA-binding domain-containing protein [Thermoanaerobaculia bacterium]